LIRFWPVDDRSAGWRAYWVWWSGEGWVFSCLELQCDKVNCTYGRWEKTLDQTCPCNWTRLWPTVGQAHLPKPCSPL